MPLLLHKLGIEHGPCSSQRYGEYYVTVQKRKPNSSCQRLFYGQVAFTCTLASGWQEVFQAYTPISRPQRPAPNN